MNQPSIIYAFDDDGERQIREIVRSSNGDLADAAVGADIQRPGDIIDRSSTRSTPTDRLPELPLPGSDGLQRDDCGEDIPAFACSSCGHPVYVGRTCYSPGCSHCWPAAVKKKVVRYAGKLDGLRRALYARYEGRRDIDFNHVVASLPSFLVDSQEPTERAFLALKTLLEEQWGIEGFAAIYHPYRIRKEYRKDQYEHAGEPGNGDMTWKDVLDAQNPEQYIKFEPHFHLFFPAVRKSFDYSVAEAVHEQSGWVFHRITKGEDSNVSVEDLDDLVHQLTYSFSHAGITDGERAELASRMKGSLHNCYAPDGIEDSILTSISEAAPRLLGHRFANTNNQSCDADVEVDKSDENADQPAAAASTAQRTAPPQKRPADRESRWTAGSNTGFRDDVDYDWGAPVPTADRDDHDHGDDCDCADEKDTETTTCGGDLVPIHEAQELLEDDDWADQAEYAEALQEAVDEWLDKRDEIEAITAYGDTPPPPDDA